MAVNSVQDYCINPKALSFTPNYQGYKNIVYVSIVSNAAIKVFLSHVSGLGYGVDAQPQTWRLSGTTTALGTASAYFIYARLSRTKQTADIIFSVRDYTVEGGYSYTDLEGNAQTVEKSDEYFYIKIGSLTETDIAGEDATVNRVLTYASGELDTFKQRNEKSDSVFEQMFEFVSSTVGEVINVKKPFHSIKVAFESVFNGLATFVKGFVLGEKEITAIATSEDDYNEEKRDSTLPTTGYVQKEIEALDDHFLIKDDADTEQSVAGPVTFEKDVTVQGDHAVGKSQTIGGNQTINGTQDVKGVQTLHQGFKTPYFFQQGDIIQGAQVDADGNAAFTSITTPVMQIYELQYNRKTAVQEEFIFSDGDTIETVTYIQADGTEIDSTAYDGEEYSYIRLGVRKQYEGYMTTFKDEDILYSNVNIIGESGQPATTGKCWMRVLALDNDLGVDPISSDGLFINAILYSEAQCPGNVNMAPTPHMVISRHGNANGILHPDRQSVFIISTKAENMVQLRGISSPIIPDTGAYAIVSGKLPSTLLAKVQKAAAFISENDPVSYARYGIFENLIQLDHEGLPIRTERYRGAWSKEVAMSDEPYTIALTTYDTVTHNGSLWMCQQSGTISEPSDTSTEWIKKVSKGSDSSAIIYEIKPSANIVYVKGGSLSTNNLDVTIGRTDSNGYFDISDQAYLDSVGLLVQWAIDGGERHDLNISPDEPIDLEDESGELLAENGNAIFLEGETIDISSIKDNITLYLVDTTTGNDMAERIIPVVKDGEDGDSPYAIIATPPNINVLVDANDESIISDVETAVYIYVKKGTSDIYPSLYYVSAEFETNSTTQGIVQVKNPIAQPVNGRWRVTIRINKGSYKQSDIPSLIRLKVYDKYATDDENNPLLIGYAEVTPSISQRGLVGPAGEAGPLLFPSGRLEFGIEYDVVYDITDTSKVVAQPFFYNQADEVYYVLQKKITAAENTEANLGNTDYWRPFTKIQYLFTEALMANWGKLASAVFWGNYQFSQYGLKDDLTKIDASAFSDTMFTNDRLNGTITPNLFLDFLSGMIKTNKLSETFKEFDYYSPREKAYVYNATSETYEEISDTPMLLCSNEIDFNSSYNIKMDSGTKFANINTDDEPITGLYNDYRLLTVPLIEDIARDGNTFVRGMDWEPDGVHASVILRPDDSWRAERYVIQNKKTDWENEHLSAYLAYGAMLCADARLFDQHSYIYTENTQQCRFFPIDNWDAVSEHSTVEKAVQGGFFVVNGEITKFLFLEPGSMVRLRSCTSKLRYGEGEGSEGTERKVTLWYVENADEFAEIPVYVRFNGNFYMTNNGTFVNHSYEHTYGKATFGGGINYTNRVFGSKIFKTVIDKIQAAEAYAEPVVNITARPDKVTEKWEDSIAQITWQDSI